MVGVFATGAFLVPMPVQASPSALAATPSVADFTTLVRALQSEESFKIRLQAAVFLGRSGEENALEPLVEALNNDNHYAVRAACAMALANLDQPRAVAHLLKRLAIDPKSYVRQEAKRALGKFEMSQALPYAVASFASDNARVRKVVINFLALQTNSEAEAVLILAVGDEKEVFIAAREALDGRGVEDAVALLRQASKHDDFKVRKGAIVLLEHFRSPEAAQVVLEVFQRDIEVESVRRASKDALRKMRAQLPLSEIVRRATDSSKKHRRATAIKTLGIIGGEEARKVIQRALRDGDTYIVGTAVMAAGELADIKMLPALEKLEKDPAKQRIGHLLRYTIKRLRQLELNTR
ncbi:HEAT repeat domain-containing protein [Myxococcota bacterium]|nr:HEAT repeat domain-containing protein [Myxococcota bacterium]